MFSNRTIEKIESEYKQELNNFDVRKMLKILEEAIDLPVDEASFEGVQRKYNYCISKLFDDAGEMSDEDREIIAENFFRIEPLLKKILYLTDKKKYNELKSQNALQCGELLDNLKIIESVRTNNGYLDLQKSADKFSGSSNQEDHILRTYKLRNVTAHEMRNWSKISLYSNIQDVMITALYTCWQYKKIIDEVYEQTDINSQIDVKDYISNIIKKYNDSVNNGFIFVPINWCYVPNVSGGDMSEQEMNIEQLLSKAKNNSHLLLLGGAGCGKTTSIEYLVYHNAKAWEKNNASPIPVKICLSETNEKWISIEDSICDVLGISFEVCKRLLSRGAINLYLDGVNEMVSSREIKTNIVRQIERFLKDYRNVFVLITDRENVEIKIDANLSTYYLHQMGEVDINKYINSKNIELEQKESIINYTIIKVSQGVCFTPILLNFIIDYYLKRHSFPEDSTELYLQYISYLLDREYNEKKDINAAPGRLDALLKYLAINMDDNELNYISTMRVFKKCVDYLGMMNIDTKNCLDLSLQLGILEQDGDMIRFSNDEYYFCLLAKGIDLKMEEWNVE